MPTWRPPGRASADAECVLEQVDRFREGDFRDRRARCRMAKTAVFPVCENIHRRAHPRRDARAGADRAGASRSEARELALRGRRECSISSGCSRSRCSCCATAQLIINELAPRPHNSGHWTIEGCVTSQFEQHVRAVCGLPFGGTGMLRPSAMVNLLGDVWSEGEPDWAAALAEPNVHLHLYGKREPRAEAQDGPPDRGRRDGRSGRGQRAKGARQSAVEMNTQIAATASPNERRRAVTRAVDLLRAGEVVALPTETVYGLAADALSAEAVVKIFETKERPRFDPLIVHLPELAWLERVAVIEEKVRPLVERLIAKFWPGPLTIVLPRREKVPPIVTAGLDTIALPDECASAFLGSGRALGRPLAAPSANRFGRISPTAAAHVHGGIIGTHSAHRGWRRDGARHRVDSGRGARERDRRSCAPGRSREMIWRSLVRFVFPPPAARNRRGNCRRIIVRKRRL